TAPQKSPPISRPRTVWSNAHRVMRALKNRKERPSRPCTSVNVMTPPLMIPYSANHKSTGDTDDTDEDALRLCAIQECNIAPPLSCHTVQAVTLWRRALPAG